MSYDAPTPDRRRLVLVGGWGTSLVIHTGLIVTAALLVWAVPKELEAPVTRTVPLVMVETPAPKPTTKPVPVTEPTPPVESDTPVEEPTPVADVVQEDQPQTETPTEEKPSPQGREDAVAASEMAGTTGLLPAIGPNASAPGAFGTRTPGGKKNALRKNHGSAAHVQAVAAALRWFKRHQSPDGRWSAVGYNVNCAEGARCEPGSAEEAGGSDVDVAMTGLALLCYLGDGHDHVHPSAYRTTVRKGLDWLLSVQAADGAFGKRNYEHPIAAMALAEAYAMSGDTALKTPAQKAIAVILARQNQDAGKDTGYGLGLGWDYTGPTARNDASVSGWNIMALKSAVGAGLDVGRGMTGAKVWLERAWRAGNTPELVTAGYASKPAGAITAYDQSRFPYVWTTGAASVAHGPHDHDLSPQPATATSGAHSMEGVGLVCGVFQGRTAGDPLVESLANTIEAHQTPRGYPCNTYSLYYNTLGMFQMGEARWKRWCEAMTATLLPSQVRSEDCRDGSWDWQGTAFHGHRTGRVLATALNTLSVEVFWRYQQVMKKH